jgi:hypothetical protein
MADENANSTVADSATTPAAAESVETAQQTPEPRKRVGLLER